MRWPVVALLVVVAVGLVSLPGCGGDSDGSAVESGTKPAKKKGCGASCARLAANANEDDHESPATADIVRPGCGEYCQQASGYGDADAAGGQMVTVKAGLVPIEPLDDGTLPLKISCEFTSLCSGALLVNVEEGGGAGEEVARVDLAIPTGATQTLGVPMSPAASELLATRGELRLIVTTDVFPSLEPLPVGERGDWKAVDVAHVTVSAADSTP